MGLRQRQAPRDEDDDSDRGDEQQLACLDTDVEEQQGQRHGLLWQADLGQRARKAEAVQQSEDEGNDPRPALCQPRPPLPCVHDLGGDEDDAQRNDRLDRRLRIEPRTILPRASHSRIEKVGNKPKTLRATEICWAGYRSTRCFAIAPMQSSMTIPASNMTTLSRTARRSVSAPVLVTRRSFRSPIACSLSNSSQGHCRCNTPG